MSNQNSVAIEGGKNAVIIQSHYMVARHGGSELCVGVWPAGLQRAHYKKHPISVKQLSILISHIRFASVSFSTYLLLFPIL